MRRIIAVLAVALAAAAFGTAAPASAQDDTGTVTVIHGVPGVDVDVYVNGDLTIPGFTPGTVADPLELPAGDYRVEIFAADADPESDEAVIDEDVALPAGANASLIAHLDEGGTPVLGVFVNDTTPTPAGEGRLVVRHTAAAPAVDILAGGEPVVTGLSNPDEETLTLPAGTVPAAVALADTTDPVIGPVDVPVVAGQVTIVYAIGTPGEGEDNTLDALVQTITVGEDEAAATPDEPAEAPPAGEAPAEDGESSVPVPHSVPSGDSGLAATGGSTFPVALALLIGAAALGGIAFSTRSLALARRR